MVGGPGRDNLNGGSGADRMWGGSGNDTLNAAYGRDRVFGGAGRDAINVATAGPASRVSCGKGRDVVRFNRNERRRVSGCERRYSIR
jgi:Ca2+-binding RTX toxin-like protein